MLTRTFVHLPGIGATREKRLWESGVTHWDSLKAQLPELFKEPKSSTLRQHLDDAEDALSKRDWAFFKEALPRDQHWRLLSTCSDAIAYLDIETTGLGMPPAAHSTTIVFYFKGEVLHAHEHEEKRKLIERVLGEATLLVTFFGSAFDVPFLQQEFGIPFTLPHIDLCFWLKRLGYKGGLKSVQKRFEEIPLRDSLDIDGYDAVRLWRLHRQGVEGALETLISYNAEDTIVLEPLLARALELELMRYPELGGFTLPRRPYPRLETRVHPEVYALLRGGQS